ncbi:MAG: DUF4080 domain-containing protein [Erysipelotrichaceae bacterium]
MKILLTTLNAKYIHKNLALRLIYAAADHDAYEVSLVEFTIKDNIERIVNQILASKAAVVAFSVYIWNIEETKRIVKKLKTANPDLHIVLGGPEVSFDCHDLFQYGVDAICQGEGEFAFWEYVDAYRLGGSRCIEGIATPENLTHHYRKEELSKVETLDPYFLEMDVLDMHQRYLYVETSRGCPYNCEYCLSSTDNQVRLFSEDYVFALLEKIAASKVEQVKFLDRTFNVSPKRALRIAQYIQEHCTNQIFQFEIVAETLSDALLDFFTNQADRARFRFEIGVQSFNPTTLQAVGRIQNNERLSEVIKRFQTAKLTMHVDLIAGLPFEDYASFRNSFDTLFGLHPEELQLGILKVLKGTTLRLRTAAFGFEYEGVAPYTIEQTKWLSKTELQAIQGAAHAVEKLYNSGRAKTVIMTVLKLGYFESAFDLFVALGKQMDTLPRPYQVLDLFQIFPRVIDDSPKITHAIAMMDYYKGTKNKPKRLQSGLILAEELSMLKQQFQQQYQLSQNLVHKYGVVDLYYDQEVTYQLVLYNDKQEKARRYVFDKTREQFKEIEQ